MFHPFIHWRACVRSMEEPGHITAVLLWTSCLISLSFLKTKVVMMNEDWLGSAGVVGSWCACLQ